MIRGLFILSAFAAACLAVPIQSYDNDPAEYTDVLSSLQNAILLDGNVSSNTDDDKKVLKEIAVDYAKYKNEDEVLAALKEKSPSLHAKIVKFRAMLKEKIAALGDEAKPFAIEVNSDIRNIRAAAFAGNTPSQEELKAKILSAVEKYNALSAAAKADLEKQFPTTASVFKDEKFQELAKKMLGMN